MTPKGGSLRERIIASGYRGKVKEREVEEWGETVYFHEMSVADIEKTMGLHEKVRDGGEEAVAQNLDVVIDQLIRSIRDKDGGAVFSTEDREFLRGQPIRLITSLQKDAMEVSGLTPEGVEAAKND